MVSHVEVLLVQQRKRQLKVRWIANKRVRVCHARVCEVGILPALAHSCVGTPIGTRGTPGQRVDEDLQDAVHKLRVISLLRERGDQSGQADDPDGELGHPGLLHEVP